MIDTIKQELQELAAESQTLVDKRAHLIDEAKKIDIRLTQISGAIIKLNEMLEKYNNNEQYTEDNDEIQ